MSIFSLYFSAEEKTTDSKAKIEQYEAKIKSLEQELASGSETSNDTISNLQKNVVDKSEEIEKLTTEKSDLEASVQLLKAKIELFEENAGTEAINANEIISKLQKEIDEKSENIEKLSIEKSEFEASIQTLHAKIDFLEANKSDQNELEATEATDLKARIRDLEEILEKNESEKQQLNDKMGALRNKAKEYLKKSKELQAKNESLEKQLENVPKEEIKDDLAEEQISMLQEMLKQKTLELSEMNDSIESMKVSHEQELQGQIELCSGLNEQLSNLSQDLSVNVQEKSYLEEEMESLKTDFEDQLKSKVDAKTETIEKLQIELAEATKSNEDFKSQAEKALAKAKSVQQNYDSLVANHGESKDLIMERDKSKAKCDLLTEKCKKLLVKCKQQEDTLKTHKELQGNLKEGNLKTKLIDLVFHEICFSRLLIWENGRYCKLNG